MALTSSDQFALYRPTDSSNRKTSLADLTTFVNATTASNLQEVTDNGSTTTNSITINKSAATDTALAIQLASTGTFAITGEGDVSFVGDLLVNSSSGIESTGVVTAYRKSATDTDSLQLWKSDVGVVGTTVGTMSGAGDLTILGKFIGDGSSLTGIDYTLQQVCDNGAVTTTGASFGGEVKINRVNDTDRGFVLQKGGADKFIVTTQGVVYVGGNDTNATAILNSDGSARFDSNITVGTGDVLGTVGIFLAPGGTVNSTNAAGNQIFTGRTSGSAVVTSYITGAGDATFSGNVTSNGSATVGGDVNVGPNPGNAASNTSGIWLGAAGRSTFYHSSSENDPYLKCVQSDGAGGSNQIAAINGDGSASFAGTLSAATIANTVPLNSWSAIPLLT